MTTDAERPEYDWSVDGFIADLLAHIEELRRESTSTKADYRTQRFPQRSPDILSDKVSGRKHPKSLT